MDASSIITQVSRDDEQLNSYPPENGKYRVLGRCRLKLNNTEHLSRLGFRGGIFRGTRGGYFICCRSIFRGCFVIYRVGEGLYVMFSFRRSLV